VRAIPDLRRATAGHMPVMDGWRGGAILVVVLHNAGAVLYGGATLPVAIAHIVLTSGWVGVQLFFVLSGFLITGILLDSQKHPAYFKNFYIRRTLRIFPLYYGFLAITLLVVPAVSGPSAWAESTRADGLWYWLYLSNWTPLLESGVNGLQHLWSLGAEEQFYLVWPALVLVSGRRFPLVALGIVFAAPAIRIGMFVAGFDLDYMYQFTVARADAFAVGALMAVTVRRPDWTRVVWLRRRVLFAGVSAGLTVVLVLSRGFAQYSPPVLLVGQSLICIWFGLAMLSSLSPHGRIERGIASLLTSVWLRGLGKYSYAIYVLHFPLHALMRSRVASFVQDAGPGTQLAMTFGYASAVLAASTAMALASWHLYEKHFLALKSRWAPRP